MSPSRSNRGDVRRLLSLLRSGSSSEKYAACWFKTFCRVLDRGFFYRCCTTSHIPPLILGLARGTDGLRVDESLTEASLAAYLEQPLPPASCAVCCGMGTESTRPIPWREVEEPRAWLEASGLPTVEAKA